jgi:hypothetical protein
MGGAVQMSVVGQVVRAHGAWAEHERHGVRSSTWRELEGLSRLLASLIQFLRGFRVTARGDALNMFYLPLRGIRMWSICN